MSVVQDDVSLNENNEEELEEDVTSETAIARIENLLHEIVNQLDEERLPVLEGNGITKAFGQWNQCRSFTNIVLVLSYCHALLLANRTTTTREVYYFYVTHFRSHKVSLHTRNEHQHRRFGYFCVCFKKHTVYYSQKNTIGMLRSHLGCCRAFGSSSSCLGLACFATRVVDR